LGERETCASPETWAERSTLEGSSCVLGSAAASVGRGRSGCGSTNSTKMVSAGRTVTAKPNDTHQKAAASPAA
jgi:hypothetical protein